MLNHKGKLGKISSILNKISKFVVLTYDESIDFTNTRYKVYSDFDKNAHFIYLDNIEIVPTYEEDVILYKSKVSKSKEK